MKKEKRLYDPYYALTGTRRPEVSVRVVNIPGDGTKKTFSLGYPPGILFSVAINGCPAIQEVDYTVTSHYSGEVFLNLTTPPHFSDIVAVSYENLAPRYSWCPHCFKKYRTFSEKTCCNECAETIVQLDINDYIFHKLPINCTKGDIMEAVIGDII